ncbi:MAG: hypothetical protein ATN35_04150 [Epulopiscium sp. Nele67-Bin004]|nr:MAG: hypothetical protein ATN35_04150 [Epulopiscium sp. Nele67-Bin004]
MKLQTQLEIVEMLEQRGQKRGIKIGEKQGIKIGEKQGIKIGEKQGVIKTLSDMLKMGISSEQLSLKYSPDIIKEAEKLAGMA